MPAQGRTELRADAIISSATAIHLGAGLFYPLGTYVRSGLVGAAGLSEGAGSFRADFLNVFHADPFRESRWGPYGAAGLSFRYDAAAGRPRTSLVVAVGVEGPQQHGYARAFEIGLGHGVRVGAILRRARDGTR